jgi:hypothetical protein
MQLEPRFIFRGNAFGFGGQIREPAVPYFEVHAPTSLPTVGGLSRAEVRGQDFARLVNFGLARSEALGGVSDFRTTGAPAEAISVPNQRQMTVVRASLFDLQVEGRLNIKQMSMALRSYEVAGEEQPWIIPEETMISGVVLDGCTIDVVLDTDPFKSYPTKQKLAKVYKEDKNWRNRYKNRFYRREKTKEDELYETKGMTFATIVERITINHKPKCKNHQGTVEVRDNLMIVPNFGKIFFGEMIVTDFYRRLSAIRLELGSPGQGSLEGAGVESNGCAAD